MSEASEQLQQARDEVENYIQTVKALLAFSAFVIHDGHEQRPGAEFGFGRRMITSKKNKVTPSNTVTPDLVAQKSDGYGITAEAKKSLPQDQTRWGRYLQQLLKYDDNLTGWWTPGEKIPRSDAVLILHHSRSRAFCRLLEQIQSVEPESIGQNTSVVEFSSSNESKPYYFFRLEHGSISDDELLQTLDNGIQVPLDGVLATFPNVRYYDSRPPVAFLLTELWMGVFPAMLDGADYDEKLKATKIPTSVRDVTDELQKAYGSASLKQDERSVEFPAYKWIKWAFEKLVEFKLALPPAEGSDTYQILFKVPRGDILSRFIELDLRHKKGKNDREIEDPDQLDLFPVEED